MGMSVSIGSIIRNAPRILVAAVLLGLLGTTRPHPTFPGWNETALDWALNLVAAGATAAIDLLLIAWTASPGLTGGAAIAVCILFTIPIARQASWANAPRDTKRLFDTQMRRQASTWCRGRCEMDGWLPFWRCHSPAEHGDHWIPWSRSGATTFGNLVMACAWHNLSKGARIPSRMETARIERRRRKYFPEGIPVDAGERYRGN